MCYDSEVDPVKDNGKGHIRHPKDLDQPLESSRTGKCKQKKVGDKRRLLNENKESEIWLLAFWHIILTRKLIVKKLTLHYASRRRG